MTVHIWLPLAAFGLNVCLVGLALFRDSGRRLNRLFAYFVGSMTLWNLGAFLLGRTPDPVVAFRWEVFIHVWVVAFPAFYLHFILAFLDATVRRRLWLLASYGLTAVFAVSNFAGHGIFMAGVQQTSWGWAPVPGLLYPVFVASSYGMFLIGFVMLSRAMRRESGVRRARARMILVGTTVMIIGSAVDLIRFAPPPLPPSLEWLDSIGIPANMACAMTFGAAIVRYRMVDLSLMTRKLAIYGAIGAAVITVLTATTWAIERALSLTEMTALLVTVPLGGALTLLLSPAGRRAEAWVERTLFSRRRGCHETLLALSREMTGILAYDRLVERLVTGLTTGIPVTHSTLLVRDDEDDTFAVRGMASTRNERDEVLQRALDGRLLWWLEQVDGAVLKDEALVNPRTAQALGGSIEALERIDAAVLLPLKREGDLRAVLLVGEKLSGEVFDGDELEMLAVLGSQAAISLENATLYERADRERRRMEALYESTRRLASAGDGEQVLCLAVAEVSRLLGLDAAALRLVEDDELVLRAAAGAWASVRPRLEVGESLSGRVIAANEPVIVEDVLADSRFHANHHRAAEELGLRSFVGVPIKQGGRTIGVLFGYSRQRRVFDSDAVSLLSAFADQISVSLEKQRLGADRRQAEETARQSEKLASMGQLLAGVAHELNNPLSVLVGYSGIVRERLTDPSLQSAAEQIETAAHRCARIVRNFLAMARKHPPERKWVALNELVTESVELVAYALRVDDVEVRLDLAADLPRLWADRYQLQQVLVNLITNAHHAMRDVTTRRLLLATRYDAERACVILRVADTGPGVPAHLQDRIFEPFFTTKPAGQGTGLGLSLCYGIVEAHRGTLALERVPGYGATLKVELPIEIPADVEAEARRPASTAGARSGDRVLVVDDEPEVAELVAELLTSDGYRVDIASSGTAALEELTARSYDVVISDIRMPGVDGHALYREATSVLGNDMPAFVFMTGDLLTGETARFLELTALPCLRKPFLADDVRRVMAEAGRTTRQQSS